MGRAGKTLQTSVAEAVFSRALSALRCTKNTVDLAGFRHAVRHCHMGTPWLIRKIYQPLKLIHIALYDLQASLCPRAVSHWHIKMHQTVINR